MPPSLISPDRNEIDFVKQAQAYINWKYPKKSIPMSFINKSNKKAKPLVLIIPSQHLKIQQFVSENWRDTIQQQASPRTTAAYAGHSSQYLHAQIEQISMDIHDIGQDLLQARYRLLNSNSHNHFLIQQDIQNMEFNIQELRHELSQLQALT